MKNNTRILTLVFVVAFLTLLVGCFPAPPITENQAPLIVSTPVTAAKIGEEYIYNVTATDPDEDILTYSLTTKPMGMTIDSATGVISWKPICGQAGDNLVIVEASDGALSDTQSFTIKVSKPPAPPAPPKTYTITATADPGGSISPSGDITVKKGSDKSFNITPDSIFYSIADVLVDGNSVGPLSSYTFVNVTEDHTIEARFTQLGCVYNQDQEKYYDTLSQLVIDEAEPGDTILVAPCTFELEPDGEGHGLNINKNGLTLKAVGATEDTIIDFSLCDLAIRIIKVEGATVEGFTMKGGGSGHQAFQVIGLETKPVSNVNILNNVIIGTTESAINLYGAWGPVTGVTISGNIIDDCYYGIMAGSGGHPISDLTISNNKITNSTQVDENWGAIGFWGEISGVIISGNEISSNKPLNGICLCGGTYNDILVEDSIISNNLGGVKIANGANFTNLVINYNNIEGNKTGVLNESALLVYAEANWWGDESGPSGVGLGTGDSVSTNVDYIPWSTSPY